MSIRNKLLGLFTVFALVLLGAAFVFFYLHGSRHIKNEAAVKSRGAASQFSMMLEEQLRHSVIEVSGLRTQLSLHLEESGPGPSPAFLHEVEHFLRMYARKYSSLILFSSDASTIVKLTPVRLFTGDLTIQRGNGSYHDLGHRHLTRFARNYTTHEKAFPHISGPNSGVYILSTPARNDGWNLLFHLRFDAIADMSIQAMNPGPEWTLAIYDSTGNTLYCNKKLFINRAAANLLEEKDTGFINNDQATLATAASIFLKNPLDLLQTTLLLKLDISPAMEQLNYLAIQGLVFVFILFGLVFGTVYTLSNRISKSISSMADVADEVAAGNLNRKIDIRRNDELGVLIDSFNTMVDNLNISYRNLRETNRELAEKVDELTSTRAKLLEKERLALIGETVSKISHEIQNKIGGISVWIQNLEMQYSGDETALIYINEIKETLQSFLYMLHNFKKFYRTPQINKTLQDAGRMIESVIDRFVSDPDSKKIHIVRDIEKELPLIPFDTLLMEEVVLNILINAAWYTPEKGTIHIRCMQRNGCVIVEVADQGPGIREDIAGRIFQPFFTTKPSGSGLGLAIAKNIVEAHSGTITVTGSGDDGATTVTGNGDDGATTATGNRNAGATTATGSGEVGACFRISLPVNNT